jgi:hypothetical protein
LFFVIVSRDPQTLSDQVEIARWRGDSLFGLFLEDVQNINGQREFDGVDGPVGVSFMIIVHDFQNASPSKALERFRVPVPRSLLGTLQGVTEGILHVIRKLSQVIKRRSNPM